MIPRDYRLEPTRSGIPTVSVRGTYIQSRYDPAKDAERAAATLAAGGFIFAGIGLALVPERYAARNPEANVVVVEPDVFLFALCLFSRPLDAFFSHPALALLVGVPAGEASAFLEKADLADLPAYENPAIVAANAPWYGEFSLLRKRNRQKREINANTLRRFGGLWLSNIGRNLRELRDRPGIAAFDCAFPDVPVVVLAAGPSLDRVLPHLPELKKRCVIIAVDTAVRACVRWGVEPDFAVLVDPQYWNWRHLDNVDAPSSVLVTESAAWPPVFRFRCREIFLCSSLFPLGKFLEERTGKKGELGAGGSVATTAWDFARRLGASEIFMAALDLGFPGLKTHFTGSIFEDRTHAAATRLSPAETAGYLALYGAGPYPVPDYRGGNVLTDKRLVLYAWWFESKVAAHPTVKTSTITDEGVKIPGFSVTGIEELERRPIRRSEINEKIAAILRSTILAPEEKSARNRRFGDAAKTLARELENLSSIAGKGKTLARAAKAETASATRRNRLVADLSEIDKKIIAHPAKDVVAMALRDDGPSGTNPLDASEALYGRIERAAEENLVVLQHFIKETANETDTYNVD